MLPCEPAGRDALLGRGRGAPGVAFAAVAVGVGGGLGSGMASAAAACMLGVVSLPAEGPAASCDRDAAPASPRRSAASPGFGLAGLSVVVACGSPGLVTADGAVPAEPAPPAPGPLGDGAGRGFGRGPGCGPLD